MIKCVRHSPLTLIYIRKSPECSSLSARKPDLKTVPDQIWLKLPGSFNKLKVKSSHLTLFHCSSLVFTGAPGDFTGCLSVFRFSAVSLLAGLSYIWMVILRNKRIVWDLVMGEKYCVQT